MAIRVQFLHNQIGGGIPVTGLIEGFLKIFFQIIDYPVPNSEQGILLEGKPDLLFPIGWLIVSWMRSCRWKYLQVEVQRIPVLSCSFLAGRGCSLPCQEDCLS